MEKLDFSNTRIAFSHLTDFELKRAYWLFWIIQSNFLVRIGPPLVRFALFLHLPVLWILRRTVFKHFCGGETIEGTKPTVAKLTERKIGAILDYSVEGAERERVFHETAREIVYTIENAFGLSEYPFCVFKMTGIAPIPILEKYSSGTAFDDSDRAPWARAQLRVEAICDYASKYRQKILIDAEETWIQRAIDQCAHDMMARYNQQEPIVFQTVQMYRVDRLHYLKTLVNYARTHGFTLGIKLVRGAYMEKERERALATGQPSPIHANKELTDKAYNDALTFCLDHLDVVALCVGTHNEESLEYFTNLMTEREISINHPHIFFAQLYGMGDHLSNNLAHVGYNVAKYVPYGPVKATLPYLFRRAEENTSVAGQSGRELVLISEELKRRSGSH